MIDIYASGPESEVAKNTVFSKRRWLLKFLMLRWWCAVLVLVEEVTNSSISSSTGGNFYEPLRGSFSGSDKPADPQKILGVSILSTCIHTHSSHSSKFVPEIVCFICCLCIFVVWYINRFIKGGNLPDSC